MTSVPNSGRRAFTRSPLNVSTYERAAGWLVALLFIVGTAALLLFVMWLTTVLEFNRRLPPVRMIEYPGRGDHAEGFARDPDPPGLEELEEVMDEPQLEAALEAVTDVASTVAAARDALQTDSVVSSSGTGEGDSRPPGPLGEGEDVIPPWERWEIRYDETNLSTYARQLDSFGIEIAAIGGAPLVDYAYNLTKPRPDTRQGESTEEERIYMTWKQGKLRAFDEQLLQRAGIETNRRILMQFIPDQINQDLHALEWENSGRDSDPRTWLKTIFGVRSRGNSYEYYIIDQMYRPAPD